MYFMDGPLRTCASRKFPKSCVQWALKNFLGLYNDAFSKQKIKIKRKSFISLWMTNDLVKSSKKKQRSYKKILKNRNPEKNPES